MQLRAARDLPDFLARLHRCHQFLWVFMMLVDFLIDIRQFQWFTDEQAEADRQIPSFQLTIKPVNWQAAVTS